MQTSNLRNLVFNSGKTQKEIAVALGLGQQRFNFYVTGRSEPDVATLILLADYFGVTVDFLVGREKSPPSKTMGLPRASGCSFPSPGAPGGSSALHGVSGVSIIR